LYLVARNRIGRVGHERRHAFLGAVGRSVCVAAENPEREAVEVVATRPADASAEALVRSGEEAGEAVRAIRTCLAGNATIDAYVVLAGKARNAVVGVITARLDTQTAFDAEVALVGRITAVAVVRASTTTRDEAT